MTDARQKRNQPGKEEYAMREDGKAVLTIKMAAEIGLFEVALHVPAPLNVAEQIARLVCAYESSKGDARD